MSKIKELVKKREKLEKELKKINKEINNQDLTFDEWVKYADKKDNPYVPSMKTKFREFFDSFDFFRYETVELDLILDLLEDRLEDGDITQEEYEQIKEDIQASGCKSWTNYW